MDGRHESDIADDIQTACEDLTSDHESSFLNLVKTDGSLDPTPVKTICVDIAELCTEKEHARIESLLANHLPLQVNSTRTLPDHIRKQNQEFLEVILNWNLDEAPEQNPYILVAKVIDENEKLYIEKMKEQEKKKGKSSHWNPLEDSFDGRDRNMVHVGGDQPFAYGVNYKVGLTWNQIMTTFGLIRISLGLSWLEERKSRNDGLYQGTG